MRYLPAILSFALINGTIISMDQQKKSSDNLSFPKKSHSEGTPKRRSAHFPISPISKAKSDEKKRTDKTKLPVNNMASSGMHGYLMAVRENNIEKVKFYLRNPRLYLNDEDEWGNTASHLAALKGHFEIIDILLSDSRTKTNVQNKSGSFPQELLERHRDGASSEIYRKLSAYKAMLFAHATLNRNVEKYASRIYPFYERGDIDQKVFIGTVNIIKKKIRDDKKKQDAELPVQAQLPAYATDDFIMEMLNHDLALLSNPKK